MGIKELFLVVGREVGSQRTIRGASPTLVFACGACPRIRCGLFGIIIIMVMVVVLVVAVGIAATAGILGFVSFVILGIHAGWVENFASFDAVESKYGSYFSSNFCGSLSTKKNTRRD